MTNNFYKIFNEDIKQVLFCFFFFNSYITSLYSLVSLASLVLDTISKKGLGSLNIKILLLIFGNRCINLNCMLNILFVHLYNNTVIRIISRI